MFADDAKLFLTHKDINFLFETANLQLENKNQSMVYFKQTVTKQNKVLIFSQTDEKGRYSAPFSKIKNK